MLVEIPGLEVALAKDRIGYIEDVYTESWFDIFYRVVITCGQDTYSSKWTTHKKALEMFREVVQFLNALQPPAPIKD